MTEKVIEENQFGSVVLFYTDQADSKYNYQDTLFASEIIERILKAKLPALEVIRHRIEGNPTNYDNLYSKMALFVKDAIQNASEAELFLLDAGGTTQMKLVLKDLLNYYTKQNNKKLEIIYIDHQTEKSYKSEREIQNKYMLLELASDYVRIHELEAALVILSKYKEVDPLHNALYVQTQIISERLRFEARRNLLDLNVTPKLPSVEKYLKRELDANCISFLKDLSSRLGVFEIATLCQFYFQKNQYTLLVATFYRLSEELAQSYIKQEIKLDLNEMKDREKFVSLAQKEVKGYIKGQKITYGLVSLLAYCHKVSKQNQQSHDVFDLLLGTCSILNGKKSGLNTLRNRCWLAHENHAITKKDIEKEVKNFFEKTGTFFQLMNKLRMPRQNEIETNINQLLELFARI